MTASLEGKFALATGPGSGMGRLAGPRDYASAAAFLASNGATLMTGQILSANGGVAIVGI